MRQTRGTGTLPTRPGGRAAVGEYGAEGAAVKAILEPMTDVAVLVVEGDSLVARNVAAFRSQIEALVRDADRVVVDLSQVQFIDSSGCDALLQYHKRLLQKGGRMGVCCVSPPVRALFELVRIQRALDIYGSREQAFSALRAYVPTQD